MGLVGGWGSSLLWRPGCDRSEAAVVLLLPLHEVGIGLRRAVRIAAEGAGLEEGPGRGDLLLDGASEALLVAPVASEEELAGPGLTPSFGGGVDGDH